MIDSQFKSFLGYFFKYLFHSKTRQKLIFLAIFGLFLSSMSLVVLQGVMQGLQGKMITRSKKVLGDYIFYVERMTYLEVKEKIKELEKERYFFVTEHEVELLGKHEGFVAPVILRGIDLSYAKKHSSFSEFFLSNVDLGGVVLGRDLANRLDVPILSKVLFYSPAHSDSFFGDIPRMSSEVVTSRISTDVNEVDEIVAWVRSSFVQKLSKQKKINRIRFYGEVEPDILSKILGKKGTLKAWEDLNPELLWAFKLESIVIVALFVAMSFLISLTIVSGNLIFFNKIRFDLISFWILGMSRKVIVKMMFLYFQLKSIVTCAFGIFVGVLVLLLLKKFSPQIMPEVFLERSLPVEIKLSHILIAFFIPYLVSIFFSLFALASFDKENKSYIELLRKVGE